MQDNFTAKDSYSIEDLIDIMTLLRSPNGCPWDRMQTHETIRMNFLEEVYEVCEAIDTSNLDLLKEELGDVLLQVVFHSAIEDEQGNFSFNDVVDGVCKKLIVRHPHIFKDRCVSADKDSLTKEAPTPPTAGDILNNWNDIKNELKGFNTHTQTLLDVPTTLPALMRAEKIASRASKAFHKDIDLKETLANMDKEYLKLKEAIIQGNSDDIEDELGDVLFNLVLLSRKLDISAEFALERCCKRFIKQFSAVEQRVALDGRKMSELYFNALYE